MSVEFFCFYSGSNLDTKVGQTQVQINSEDSGRESLVVLLSDITESGRDWKANNEGYLL